MGGARGKAWGATAFCALALALAPGCPFRRNVDGNKVPFANHTHANMCFIRRHLCKTTQISVIFLAFPNTKNRQIWGFH